VNEELFRKAADLITNSSKTVALTGAGISTPSGIADFRSPGSGLWEKVDPMQVATIDAFMSDPKKFYDFMTPLSDMVEKAVPNPAHKVLCNWEKMGFLHSIITQNIDNLHQKAGSKNVIELHGNGQRAYCVKCKTFFEPHETRSRAEEGGGVPKCDCGGNIKPDVILFGEMLPLAALVQAEKDTETCEVMIIVGSSLTVTPASMLPQIALANGAKLIVVNIQETYVDSRAEVVIRDKVETALPEIAERI